MAIEKFSCGGSVFQRRALVAAVLALLGLFSQPAFAFKVMMHVASANETLEQLSHVTPSNQVTDTLVFTVKGQRLEVQINSKEAYRAILDNPDFFRAGVVGPDGFPDLVTGQFWQHSNENTLAKDLVRRLTSNAVAPADHAAPDPAQNRRGTSELRSIDFAMELLEFWNSGGYPFASNSDARVGERAQALAFIMGYFAHGVGDSFAHTWVNEYAGGAWELGAGAGVFGPGSEEAKHIAAEGLTASRVPGRLQNADGTVGGELDRMNIRAPIFFLDAFFSRNLKPDTRPIPFGNNQSSDPAAFFDFYKQTDRFYGAAIYNYYNLQVDAAQALKNFSGLGAFVDLADRWQPGPFLNTILDIYDFPAQLLAEIEGWFGGQFIPAITGGFLKCELFLNDTTGLEAIRKVWDYLGGFNDRIRRYEDRARVARINWLRLSECTAQNVIRSHGGDFDPAEPGRFRDACTVLAEKPFADQGDGTGLYRGQIREGDDDSDEYLADLRSYFKASDDDGGGLFTPEEFIEPANGHRRLGANLRRMRSYLMGFSFTLDDLEDVVITDKHETSFTEACNLARSPGERHCLNLALFPFAFGFRQAECAVDLAGCTAGAVANCLTGLCETACSSTPLSLIGVCDNVCDATEAACRAAVNTSCDLVPGACVGIPGVACVRTPIYDACVGALGAACGFLAGGDPRCAANLVGCGAEAVVCSFQALELIFLQEGWADEILGPIASFCNTIDAARAFFDRFDTLQERTAFAESHGVPVTEFLDLATMYERISDKFAGFPPEYFVNVAFLQEDLRDPAYLADYLTALQAFEAQNSALPSGEEKELREGAARKLREWAAAAPNNGAGNANPLLNVDLDPTTAQARRDLREFEKLVESLVIPRVAGPTAQKILRDVGPDMSRTYNPFFNTVQGMKIIPMNSRLDIERMFNQQGVSTARLPWNIAGEFSQHCSNVGGPESLYCDVLISFDDPNCFGPTGDGCTRHIPSEFDPQLPNPARFNWVQGRGLIPWNNYDRTGATPPFVLTNFPLSSSEEAYRALYVKIFDVPQQVPLFAGLEDPTRPWTRVNGSATITPTTEDASQGRTSLRINGCNYMQLNSPVFDTPEFEIVGSKLAIDIKLPVQQANPSWIGDMQLLVSVPAAGVNNASLGHHPLTGLPRGTWTTLEFDVPSNVQAALLGDNPQSFITVALNVASCQAPVFIDNLRFTGELQQRTVFHRSGSQGINVRTTPLFSFDNQADWSSSATLAAAPASLVRDGTGALAIVNTSGYRQITSRPFTNAQAPVPTAASQLSIDLFMPAPQPNTFWQGDLQLFLTCPSRNLQNAYIGSQALTYREQNDYNQLLFPLPSNVSTVLRGTYTDCSIKLALNVAPGAGTFVFERMGFVP